MISAAENTGEIKVISQQYLNSIRNLPSIPIVMFEVTKLLDNPMTSTYELGKIISRDQGLTAKILAVANSPLYGLPRKVSTIDFAIVILGFDQIKNIVIALSMIEAFNGKDKDDWKRKKFWAHSLTTAVAAKRISEDLGIAKPTEAFTGGLLHDLGISVIQRYFNNEFKKIIKLVETKEISYLEAESKVLGMTHQEVGKFLAEKWNLPDSLSETIAFHHTPSYSENYKSLVSIIHLADYMTHKLQIGTFAWDETNHLDENVISILNLGSMAYVEKFIQSYEPVFKSHLESMGL